MSTTRMISEKTFLHMKAELALMPALKEDAKKLAALEAGGVDNWEGYDDAMHNGGLYDSVEIDEEVDPPVVEVVEK